MTDHLIQILGGFASILAPWMLGTALVSISCRDLPALAVVSAGYHVGWMVTILVMFTGSWAGFSFGGGFVAAVCLTYSALILLFWRFSAVWPPSALLSCLRRAGQEARGVGANLPVLLKILLVVLIAMVGYNLFIAAHTPPVLWDEIGQHVKRSQIFFHHRSMVTAPEGQYHIATPNYPPLVPLQRTWMYLLGGEAETVISSLHYANALAFLFALVVRYRGIRAGLYLGLVFSLNAFPGGTNSMLDFTAACYMLLGVGCLYLGMRENRFDTLILGSFLLGSAAWVRPDAQVYGLIAVIWPAVWCLARGHWVMAVATVGMIGAVIAPWIIYSRYVRGWMTLLDQYAPLILSKLTLGVIFLPEHRHVWLATWEAANGDAYLLIFLILVLITDIARLHGTAYFAWVIPVQVALLFATAMAFTLAGRPDIVRQSIPRVALMIQPLVILWIGLLLDFRRSRATDRPVHATQTCQDAGE